MKVIINTCFGGYGIDEELAHSLGYAPYDWATRTDPRVIAAVEADADAAARDDCSELEVAEIPDTATDWDIQDYDGCETLIYVVDGKIHYYD